MTAVFWADEVAFHDLAVEGVHSDRDAWRQLVRFCLASGRRALGTTAVKCSGVTGAANLST